MTTSQRTGDYFKQPAVLRSRWAYAVENVFDYFVSILVGGAFFAKLLTHLGLDDSLIGVISSISSFAFLFQLLSLFVVKGLRNTKPFVVIFHTLSRTMFIILYLLPFFPFGQRMREAAVLLCVLLAYFSVYFVGSISYKWSNSYVDPMHRAEFCALKEIISLAGGIIVSLSAGYIIDSYAAVGNVEGGFLFTASAILIFSVCDIVCYLLIKSDKRPKDAPAAVQPPMREALGGTLGNKNFRSVLIAASLWYMGRFTIIGFIGTYLVNPHELAFSVGAVQIINLLGSGGRILISRPFGRYTDRTSFARGLKLALCILALAYGINAFTSPATRYLIIVYVILSESCMAGLNANMSNILYSYVDEKYFVHAMALKNSIAGLCGFGASILAGRLLAHIQASGNSLFGIPVYGQQVLSLISFLLIIADVLFVHLVLEKQKVIRR